MSRVDDAEKLAELFKALSHPLRLKILALCSIGEHTSRELARILGVSRPLVIAHLRVLLRAGLVTYRVVVDEEKMVVKKLYRAVDVDVCLTRRVLKSLAERLIGGSSSNGTV